MGEIINLSENKDENMQENNLIQIAEDIFLDTKTNINKFEHLSMPIAKLATLGGGVASLLPVFNTVTQTTTVDLQGYYKLANANIGDVLKTAKSGNFWGALKTAEGASKMAQFEAAGPITATTETVAALNPATAMMAVALYSIECQLGNIAELEKQIITFLAVEQEAEIEADIKTLSTITAEYKYNWDNEHYVSSNHKMVLDIQRTARKNMIAFQKQVSEAIDSTKKIVAQNKVNAELDNLMKKFNYYRLSLFAFSMASMLEAMLSGNFKEEYLLDVKGEIEKNSMNYRSLYGKASIHLENLAKAAIEGNLQKGIGNAMDAVGKFIGKIPVIEKGPVDEFLQEHGKNLKKQAKKIENDSVGTFAELSNPGTSIFIDKIKDMIQIYNHTESIYFDDKNLYLVAC